MIKMEKSESINHGGINNVIENLLEDLKNLETQHSKTKQKLHEVLNHLKTEEHEVNSFEASVDELKQSVTFYKKQVAKMSQKLIYKKKIYSKFDYATEYYKRLIATYEETLKQEVDLVSNHSTKVTEIKQTNKQVQQGIERLKTDTQNNLKIINDLLVALLSSETKE